MSLNKKTDRIIEDYCNKFVNIDRQRSFLLEAVYNAEFGTKHYSKALFLVGKPGIEMLSFIECMVNLYSEIGYLKKTNKHIVVISECIFDETKIINEADTVYANGESLLLVICGSILEKYLRLIITLAEKELPLLCVLLSSEQWQEIICIDYGIKTHYEMFSFDFYSVDENGRDFDSYNSD